MNDKLPLSLNRCRETFEKWYGDPTGRAVERNKDGFYELLTTQNRWEAWQGAWKAASRCEILGNKPICLPQNEDKKVCPSQDADLEDVSKIVHCVDCGKRLCAEEILYLTNTCNDCESKAWDGVLHEGEERPTPPPDKAYGYASRLFKHLAPQCTPLPDTLGVLTQLDNYIAGLREPKREAVEDKWERLKTAPYDKAVLVCTHGGYVFPAILRKDASENAEGETVDQWVAALEGFHPPCWSEGGCWESNTEESESDQPLWWRPLVYSIEDGSANDK